MHGVVARFALVLVVTAAACGGEKVAVDAAAPAAAAPSAPAAPPPFPEGTLSLRLVRTVAVRHSAGDDGKQIGTVAQDIRVGWTRTETARGCKKPWVEITPRGWVCGEYLEPSTKPTFGVELPRVGRGEVVPGVYGKLNEAGTTTYELVEPDDKAGSGTAADRRKPPEKPVSSPDEVDPPVEAAAGRVLKPGRPLLGTVNVRKYAEVVVNGRVYWKINPHEEEFIPASTVHQHEPSPYGGVRLGDDTGLALPLVFVWPRWGGAKAWTKTALKGGGPNRQLPQRWAAPLLETATSPEGKVVAYKIGEYEWIDAGDARLAEAAPPPPLIKEGERWFDVDSDRQILIAYEGTYPVYATLISSGTKETPTETGLFRIWKKVTETDMRGLSGEDPYSVATVPWTQFFSPEKGLALHAAYWHDKFGIPRSHGCVNLSPVDARWLYFWSDPQVPPGWTMAAGISEAPGSIVRVRSKDDPEPPWKGYAIKVAAQRAEEAKEHL